ncbi:MAG: hypothetical protein ABEI74_03245 [Candidatus Pacearchaeota archaeon]
MEDLKRYIREGRENGVSDKKLKKHLLDNGFSEDQVEDAFLEFDTEEINEDSEKERSSSKQCRKDLPEEFMDDNKNFGKFAKKYSGYAISSVR